MAPLRTISEINGFLDDLNSHFSSSSNFDDSESEGKCYIDFQKLAKILDVFIVGPPPPQKKKVEPFEN